MCALKQFFYNTQALFKQSFHLSDSFKYDLYKLRHKIIMKYSWFMWEEWVISVKYHQKLGYAVSILHASLTTEGKDWVWIEMKFHYISLNGNQTLLALGIIFFSRGFIVTSLRNFRSDYHFLLFDTFIHKHLFTGITW